MTVAAGQIINAVASIMANDRGDDDWGGHGLSTQITKTDKSAATTYVEGSLNEILTGQTGRVFMREKIDKMPLYLSAGLVVFYFLRDK